MSFYCTLSSASPNDKHSHNFGGRFWSDLPSGLFLDNRWKVGLVELIYKRDWATVREGENKIVLDYFNTQNTMAREEFLVPPGHYTKEYQLFETFSQMTVPGLKFDMVKDKIMLTYQPDTETCKWWRIGISISLAEILGFTQDQEFFRDAAISYFREPGAGPPDHTRACKDNLFTMVSKRDMALERDLDTLFVRCNIIEPQIIGNQLMPVLRIIPVEGAYGKTVSVQYSKPHYVHLSQCVIQSILIEIFPTYSARPIPFESGVILKLHFRKEE